MIRKLVLLTIMLTVICSLSAVYAMGSAPTIKSVEITAESFAPGTYKVYKNDELGFSFRYPKDWFIAEFASPKPSPVMSFQLSNFDTYKMPTIPKEKQFYIICVASQDYYEETNDKEKRMFYVVDKVFGIAGGHAEIKRIISVFPVKGGKVYLVKMTREDSGSKEYEIGMTYLEKNNDKYLITFFPDRIADRGIYLKILRSAEIY